MATRVQQLRAELPSLLMNIGDTYHGGVEALYTEGEAISAPVNALGIDVGVPGNWDYAYGPAVTRLRYLGTLSNTNMAECIAEATDAGISFATGGDGGTMGSFTMPSFPMLAANVTVSASRRTPTGPFLPPTLLKQVGGVNVGFIGLSSDIVPQMHPILACGLTFLGSSNISSGDAAGWTSAYTSLVESLAQSLRSQGATIVVVMSELGLQKNFYLANSLAPGTIDVLFSAHTHEAIFTPLASTSGALVVEAGDDTYLGHMDIQVVDGGVASRTWTLEPLTSDIPEDPTMTSLVDTARAPFLVTDPNMTIPGPTGAQLALHQPITTVIGTAPFLLTRKNSLENSFNDFFTEALRTRAGTALGMAPGFRMDSPIATTSAEVEGSISASGQVTLEDVYRFFPVVYGMGTATVTGSTLSGILEDGMESVFSTSVPLQAGGWLEGYSGMQVDVNLAKPKGQRVLSMSLTDAGPMSSSLAYTIAGCRRPYDPPGVRWTFAGFSNVQHRLMPDAGADGGQPWTDVEIFIDGLSRSPAISPARVFTDANQTPLWPQDPYVQPLLGAQ